MLLTVLFLYISSINAETTMVGSLSESEGWKATAKTALNDCKISSTWDIKFDKSGEGALLKYSATITGLSNSTEDCKSLTPNFANIAHN